MRQILALTVMASLAAGIAAGQEVPKQMFEYSQRPVTRTQKHKARLAARRANPPPVLNQPVGEIPEAGPDLRLLSVTVLDAAGNNDGWIQPGETVQLQVALSNFGNSSAQSVYGQLNPGESNPYLTILNVGADWPDIPAHGIGTTLSPHFQISASNILPCGYKAELSLTVNAVGFSTTVPVQLDLTRTYSIDTVADAARRYDESDFVVYGQDGSDALGRSVGHGDVNGDGFDDLILGAPNADGIANGKSFAGEVWLIYGSTTGLPPVIDLFSAAANATVIVGPDSGDNLGFSVSAGDVNGDGFDDLILGAPTADAAANAKPSAGEVWIIYGQATQLPASIDLFAPPANAKVIYGADSVDNLGDFVSTGDVNGDGFDDLILGAQFADAAANGKSSAGDVWVIYGQAMQLPASIDLFSSPANATVIYGADAGDSLGDSVFAGDVDGDGFDDLILGASAADAAANGKSTAGDVWLIYGQAAQLPASIDLFSPPANATVIYGPDTVDRLGTSVSAGDVNGDGFDDLILGAIGADGATNGQLGAGDVWLIYGGATRLPVSIDLFAPPANATVIYGSDSGDNLGISVSAGDVSGDGFDDLILGAYFADAAGNSKSIAGDVWLIYGQATQLPSIDLLFPAGNARVIYGPDLGDALGFSAAAGDLNGDGFDDLILGAYFANGVANGKPLAGEVHVVLGAGTTTYWHRAETFSFIDASAGTNLNLACDNCSASIPIGFTLPFYGEKFSTLYVSSNGFISFTPINDSVSAVPRCISSKSPSSLSSLPLIVAPFWDNLDLRSSGAVYYQLSGVAPNRRLTIEWLNVPHYPNIGTATFEVSLFESTGQILFQYLDVDFGNASYNFGASAVVGTQNRTAAQGTNYSCSQTLISAVQALSLNLSVPLFEDSMESLDTTVSPSKPGKWTMSSGALWHTLPLAAGVCTPSFHGRGASLYEGNNASCVYNNNIVSDYLYSPLVSSFPADARLSFWQRFQSEPAVDGGAVWVNNFFSPTVIFSQSGVVASGAWHSSAPLFMNANAGETVELQFISWANASVVDLGWMIDDVKITGCNAVGIASLASSVAYALPPIYCGNGTNTGKLDAVGSACGDGSAPAYQWLESGTPIPGATSISYTIPAGHPAGTFCLAVTVTCAGGSSTSSPQCVDIVAPPQAVGNTLMLAKANGGADLTFNWTDVSSATEYFVFEDTVASGPFSASIGTGLSGTAGLTVAMPSGALLFYKVAGSNGTCGLGPK